MQHPCYLAEIFGGRILPHVICAYLSRTQFLVSAAILKYLNVKQNVPATWQLSVSTNRIGQCRLQRMHSTIHFKNSCDIAPKRARS